ncbi:PAS domain S-box protein [Bacillus suaedaesalsae]|uniref:histidine kinase n=1 Tax=Bacillus suaedaesalsae TaxID=2810349 RepID=A0ABS2DDH1_9BACI|nr:PAS domain S-box protein [Bacillus suaedaesalsae]MBM6616509.1 PAS domain S-box protein [Bacillus suaedaesalsae]
MQSKYVDHLRDAFFVLDKNWCFAYLNNEAENLLQKNKKELLGTLVWSEFEEAVNSSFFANYHKALHERITVEFQEYYSPLKTWFDVRAYPVEEGLAVHFRDVNESKKLLAESREHYRSLFDQNPDAVFSFDLEGNYLSLNNSFERLLGYSRDEYLQMDFTPLVIPEHSEKTQIHFEKAAKGVPQTYEVTCLRKDGSLVHVNVTNVPIVVDGQIVGVYGIAKDISKRKQAEIDLKVTEASLRSALRVAKLGSWEWHLESDKLIWSDEMVKLVGWDVDPQTLTYQQFLRIVHPLDREKINKNLEVAITNQQFNLHFRIMKPDGQIRFVESNGEALFDEDGYPIKIIGTSQDITERTIEQESLRRSEELYELITTNSQDIIMYITLGGNIRYVSPAVEKILGYKPESLNGFSIKELIHPEELEEVLNLNLVLTDVFTGRFLHREGHYVWIETSIKVIRNTNGTIDKILAIGRDITERITAKELMVKSEKLNLAGQLAAGIAHEIRNPLTAIKGFLQLMEQGHTLRREYFNIVGSELTRIEFILNELLLLAKPTVLKFERREVTSILSQVATLLETEAILKNVEVRTNLLEEVYINCDENQLKQVFINFVKNAIEAMPHGGNVYIEAKRDNDYVTIMFKDEGCGIPEDKLKLIGQPFYTTKEKGTGLGLAVSYSIIENHKGEIFFESTVNKGTTIFVKLPLFGHGSMNIKEEVATLH